MGFQEQSSKDWSFVNFPMDECERRFARDGLLSRWERTSDIQSIDFEGLRAALLKQTIGFTPDFIESFATECGFPLSTRQAAWIALCFYLWQRPASDKEGFLSIMPYYFRGLSFNSPAYSSRQVMPESTQTFVGVSCSANSGGLHAEE